MRVLSIDGGGIRGIVPATVLAALEQRTAKPANELFDLIAGTSTGGILALALTAPGPDGGPRWNATAILDLYREEGPKIFSRSLGRRITSIEGLIDERYPSENLRAVLQRYLGGATLEQALTPMLVTSYDLVARKPRFFKSWRDDDVGVPMALAAEATSAAPTYFEPVLVDGTPLVDGGVFAGNPAMCAYAEARRLRPDDEDVLLVSLGTGSLTRPITYDQAKDWGLLEWARPVIDVVLDGSSDAVDYQLDQLLADRHVRLQAALTDANDNMDDASAANLDALARTGRRLVEENAARLDALAAEIGR
ncbi:patatin-like phospholipase family protein [Capillimicrobium parvum]|uniref:CUMP-AMP-activated phospholipase n=1 Tax=Capillimicrobium parvum TaxID=2884022 RepID=A0A9E7C248_9ACTN|nr:patatin-like phospholipase family protein [Capillimicrobium parvum]UGS38086.1 cUMP-AMP-activated phospholipase [Capillimicrobium parvum]